MAAIYLGCVVLGALLLWFREEIADWPPKDEPWTIVVYGVVLVVMGAVLHAVYVAGFLPARGGPGPGSRTSSSSRIGLTSCCTMPACDPPPRLLAEARPPGLVRPLIGTGVTGVRRAIVYYWPHATPSAPRRRRNRHPRHRAGNERRPLFRDDADRERYLDLLAESLREARRARPRLLPDAEPRPSRAADRGRPRLPRRARRPLALRAVLQPALRPVGAPLPGAVPGRSSSTGTPTSSRSSATSTGTR